MAEDWDEMEESCVGRVDDWVGMEETCVGRVDDWVGMEEICVGRVDDCVGRVDDWVGMEEICVGIVDDCVGRVETVLSINILDWEGRVDCVLTGVDGGIISNTSILLSIHSISPSAYLKIIQHINNYLIRYFSFCCSMILPSYHSSS